MLIRETRAGRRSRAKKAYPFLCALGAFVAAAGYLALRPYWYVLGDDGGSESKDHSDDGGRKLHFVRDRW